MTLSADLKRLSESNKITQSLPLSVFSKALEISEFIGLFNLNVLHYISFERKTLILDWENDDAKYGAIQLSEGMYEFLMWHKSIAVSPLITMCSGDINDLTFEEVHKIINIYNSSYREKT